MLVILAPVTWPVFHFHDQDHVTITGYGKRYKVGGGCKSICRELHRGIGGALDGVGGACCGGIEGIQLITANRQCDISIEAYDGGSGLIWLEQPEDLQYPTVLLMVAVLAAPRSKAAPLTPLAVNVCDVVAKNYRVVADAIDYGDTIVTQFIGTDGDLGTHDSRQVDLCGMRSAG